MVENQGGEASQAVYNQSFHDFHDFQEYQGFLQNQHYNEGYASGFAFPDPSPIFPWSIPPVHGFNAIDFNINPSRNHGVLHSNSLSSSLYNLRSSGLEFAYDGSSISHLGIAAIYGGSSDAFAHTIRSGSSSFSLQSELGKMTAQEIMDAKALAASRSHSEAERRRRERINTHLAKLRSLLPNTTKTDKASLLAEVIQHVKELKRQTSEIAESSPVPTESDELTVDDATEQDGKFVIKASLCCEDRSDLLPDIIRTLKSLRLKTLKAEITTMGGRVKNVLVVTGEENGENIEQYSITSIQEALKSVMERTSGGNSSPGSIKRQRTNISILDHRSF